MQLDIITPDANLFSGTVSAVRFPGSDGSFGVLERHAPLIATLKAGTINITDDRQQAQQIHIKGGVVEVLDNRIMVLAE